MQAGWSGVRKVCGWGCVQDQPLLLSRKSIFQGLKKEGEAGGRLQKKVCQNFGCLGCSKVLAARVFLAVVSKLNIVRKGTISIHCTAKNVGVSFVKGIEGLPCCCHSSHLHQPLHSQKSNHLPTPMAL